MSSALAIETDQLSKVYLRNPARRFSRERRVAVDDVSLTIEQGESVGILGHNGAGKTTLLRLLAGVTAPTSGQVRTWGRVVPVISVGVGFHAELSGRENVTVNAKILGLTDEQIAARYDSIVEFAELEGHMDRPVKFYSSGMQLRLAFAVAMHVDADVLLLDEILAVGDTAFQLKCIEHMTRLTEGGSTVVFVSQSVHAVRLLCPRALVMDEGRVVFDGTSIEAVGTYHRVLSARSHMTNPEHPDDTRVRVIDVALLDDNGRVVEELERGRSFTLRHRVVARESQRLDGAELRIKSEAGIEFHHERMDLREVDLAASEEVELDIDFVCRLVGGSYRFEVTLLDGDRVVSPAGTGAVVYRTPALGSYGIAELDATIAVDGKVINDHDAMRLGTGS